MNEVLKAQKTLLQEKYDVAADVWSVTSYKELRRDGLEAERWNLLHPDESLACLTSRNCYASTKTASFVASSDYMKALPDSISRWVPGELISLGTDGFGRSDSRKGLRDFFEVDARYITLAALEGLARQGRIDRECAEAAIKELGINPKKKNPMTFRKGRIKSWQWNSSFPSSVRISISASVVKVLVGVGDKRSSNDQPVMELETDKATIEVPAIVGGVVREIRVKEGDKASVGQVVLTVDSDSSPAGGSAEKKDSATPGKEIRSIGCAKENQVGRKKAAPPPSKPAARSKRTAFKRAAQRRIQDSGTR